MTVKDPHNQIESALVVKEKDFWQTCLSEAMVHNHHEGSSIANVFLFFLIGFYSLTIVT